MSTHALMSLSAGLLAALAAGQDTTTVEVAAADLTSSDVMWLARNVWGVHKSVVEELSGGGEGFTLGMLNCEFLEALKAEPFRFMHFQHFCDAATAAKTQTFLKTTDADGVVQELMVAPPVDLNNRRRRRLAAADTWSGLNIKRDRAAITLGADADVGMYRSGDGVLNLTATSAVVVNSDMEVVGGLTANGVDVLAELSGHEDVMVSNAADISSNADDISAANAAISANEDDIAANAVNIAANADDISANTAGISTNAAAISALDTDLQGQIDGVYKTAACSKTECCMDSYSWSGSELKCWNALYTSYEDDPCSCRAVVYNLGSATAFQHQQNCVSKGANLMSIHSAAAAAAVAEYSGPNLWIGVYDRKVEGYWHHFDGTPTMYTNWNSGEPNDSSGEDCVHTTGTPPVLWNDQDCEESISSLYGICLWQ